MRRLAADEEKNPPTSEFECPKPGEVTAPIGVPRFTLLKIFRALTLKVRL
jgi:hypothetical protein